MKKMVRIGEFCGKMKNLPNFERKNRKNCEICGICKEKVGFEKKIRMDLKGKNVIYGKRDFFFKRTLPDLKRDFLFIFDGLPWI